MQEDSPGRREKYSINDRYSTPTQPKRLSASSAKQKAKDYAAKDNKSTRVLAKQAILKELSTQLFIRAQGLSRTFFQEDDKSGNQVKNVAGSLKPADGKGKELQETRTGSSRIPRRVGKTYTTTHRKRPLKPASELRPVDIQQEALPRSKADKKFQQARARFLAEKYVTLWKRNTYGRVDPTAARLHYERNLKQYTLQVWQDIWWAGRRGWKLNIRADYHNRYRLWQKVWKAWKEYMNYCNEKRGKKKSAVQQAQQTLLSRCWAGWIHYIRTRRTKTQENKKAMVLAERQLKRRVWGFWLAQLVFRQDLRGMDHEALQFWAVSLMSKAWRVWTFAWYAKDEERSKIAVASRFANQRQLLKMWRGWKNYRAVRKLRMLQKGAANRHFYRTVLRKSINIWVVRWQRQTELAQFNDLILLKSDIALARRAFVHWKFYIAIRHTDTELKQSADGHYELHLLLQAVNRRLKEMRNKMAVDACQRFRLQRAWNVWMKRCEHSEELKLHSLSRKARAHHSSQVKRKGILCWLRYCHWRRSRKSQYAKAEFHFRVRALPRYFCRMMIFVDLIHLKKTNELAAAKFRREVLLAKMFYKWWSQYQLLMNVGVMERMAILHHDEVAKRRCLQFWCQRTRNELLEKKRELLSDNHRSRRLLRTALSRWREFNREMKESRSVHHSAVRHYYIRLLRKTWDAWQQFVHARQIKWQKQARSGIHYQHRLLSHVLNTWKSYQRHLNRVKVHCEERFREHNLARLRLAFKTWQLNAVRSREEKKHRSVAKTFLHQTLLAKSFFFWREYAAFRVVKKYEQSQRLHEIRQKLDRGKLSRSFGAWRSFTRKCVEYKQLSSRADCHFNKLLLHKALNSWKCFIHFCFRIKVLQRQSMWLHNRRITARFFRKWKKQHGISLQEKEMTLLALWHWSVNLQSKVFFALMEYAMARKRKALRIAKALDDRRNRLLRAGVTQWMKVAFHLTTERTRLAQTRQLEAAFSVHQCVHRCAVHWRRVAAKRIRQRGGKPKPRPVTTLKRDFLEDTVSARQIPAVLPSSYPREVDRILPEPFNERPRPRRPDYLRDSYDVAQISMTSVASKFTASAAPRTQNLDDEAKPRSSPPLPVNQMRSNFHPLQRNPREESIVFPSSSGEDSFVSQDRKRGTGEIPTDAIKTVLSKSPQLQQLSVATVKPAHEPAPAQPTHIPLKTGGGQRRPVLLPPSSFGLPSRTKRAPSNPSCPVGDEVRASGSTLPASTPRTSLDSQKHLASSPSSAASSPSGGSEQAAERRDVTREGNNNSFDGENEHESSDEWEGDQGGKDDEKNDQNERDEGREKNGWENGLWSQLRQEGNLQERIFTMKKILQEFHDLKVKHSHKRQQRNQLSIWVRKQREDLGPNHEDRELQETQQCLNDLTDEVQQLADRMKQTRPLVEEVAVSIRELIQKAGLT